MRHSPFVVACLVVGLLSAAAARAQGSEPRRIAPELFPAVPGGLEAPRTSAATEALRPASVPVDGRGEPCAAMASRAARLGCLREASRLSAEGVGEAVVAARES